MTNTAMPYEEPGKYTAPEPPEQMSVEQGHAWQDGYEAALRFADAGWQFSCEAHDEPGHCARECEELMSLMMSSDGVDDLYGYDPTGCSYPEWSYHSEVRLYGMEVQVRHLRTHANGFTEVVPER